ncbi:MAG: hypothetical protein IPN60_20905 [Saprospiraceae bacterium]|nr:hypothetical protein [Candidatus Opimibacter skivensis]
MISNYLDMIGFELLQQVGEISFKTVFTTSHSHYAIKAFSFQCTDYLVKPINETELKEAIQRIGNTTPSVDVSLALQNQAKSVEEQKLVCPRKQAPCGLL